MTWLVVYFFDDDKIAMHVRKKKTKKMILTGHFRVVVV